MLLDVKESLLCILHRVRDYDDYFLLKKDVTGLDFTSYKKCTVPMRMLAYGVAGDLVDEYMPISYSTFLNSKYNFYRKVVQVFA
jgi:hypothetical protein